MKRSANSSNVLSEDYIQHKKRLLESDREFLFMIKHKAAMSHVLEELIRCTPCHPAIASAHKMCSMWVDEEEITWWELTSDEMLWIETIDEINNILL